MSVTRLDGGILVVGAGPVGLLLANLLGARGNRVLVVDKRTEPPTQSMAIGITPPSLEILRDIGLDAVFERAGVTVRQATVWEAGQPLGRLAFDGLPTDYRYILSLPQSRTVALLREGLGRYPSVTLSLGTEFCGYLSGPEGVAVNLRELGSGIELQVRAAYLVGADGHRSVVRQAAGIGVREHHYRQRWIMADFADRTGLGSEAHLFFSAEASVESFPLPGGRRRWILLTPAGVGSEPVGHLRAQVLRLTGHDPGSAGDFVSAFGAKRMLADRYVRDRVLLCGDAAHVMSSIGGQGMNTGFADAQLAARSLLAALAEPATAPAVLARYEAVRRKAYRVAADRAARGMRLGTARGRLWSALRTWIIRDFLFGPWMVRRLAPYFAMLTIPANPPVGEHP